MRKLAIILIVMGPLLTYSQIPAEGLVAYWPFNGNANDESGNGNHGAVYGATLVPNRFGNENSAYEYDGVDDYIELPPNNYFDGDFSVSGWIYYESVIEPSSFFDFSQGNHVNSVRINTYAYGGPFTHGQIYVGSTGSNLQCDINYPYNSWTHFVLTLNNYTYSFYVDGEFINSGESNHIPTNVIRNVNYFGRNSEPGNVYTEMTMDDFRIYNRALNQDEIIALYNEAFAAIVIQQPESQIVCKGDFVNFNVNASGEEPIFYQWQKNNENIPNATGNIFSLSNVQLSDEGEYRCIVSNNNGSDTSNTATLTVDIVPMADIFGPPSVDEWQVATYSVTPQGGHQYEFWVDGGNILQNNSNNIEVQWGAVGYGHVYMLETNVSGCMSDTNSLQVAIGSVGINSISDNESISVYPQPANEKLFINLLSNNYNLLQIADLKGNVLIEQDIYSEKEVVSIESLSPGVYILSISNQFERVVKKFVKM